MTMTLDDIFKLAAEDESKKIESTQSFLEDKRGKFRVDQLAAIDSQFYGSLGRGEWTTELDAEIVVSEIALHGSYVLIRYRKWEIYIYPSYWISFWKKDLGNLPREDHHVVRMDSRIPHGSLTDGVQMCAIFPTQYHIKTLDHEGCVASYSPSTTSTPMEVQCRWGKFYLTLGGLLMGIDKLAAEDKDYLRIREETVWASVEASEESCKFVQEPITTTTTRGD